MHNNKVKRKYGFYVIYNSPYNPLHQKCFIRLANVAHHRRQFVLVSNYNNITYVLIYTAVAREFAEYIVVITKTAKLQRVYN